MIFELIHIFCALGLGFTLGMGLITHFLCGLIINMSMR